jgi:hypothetical protein
MFSKSLTMIKIDRKLSELWEIVCNKYRFDMSAFVGFIMWIIYLCTDMNCILE